MQVSNFLSLADHWLWNLEWPTATNGSYHFLKHLLDLEYFYFLFNGQDVKLSVNYLIVKLFWLMLFVLYIRTSCYWNPYKDISYILKSRRFVTEQKPDTPISSIRKWHWLVFMFCKTWKLSSSVVEVLLELSTEHVYSVCDKLRLPQLLKFLVHYQRFKIES